jgi:hypothetical protein
LVFNQPFCPIFHLLHWFFPSLFWQGNWLKLKVFRFESANSRRRRHDPCIIYCLVGAKLSKSFLEAHAVGCTKSPKEPFFSFLFFPHLMSLLFSVVRTPAYVHISGLVIIIVFGHQNWPHLALYVAPSFPLCSQIRVHCIYIRHILMLNVGICSLAARPFWSPFLGHMLIFTIDPFTFDHWITENSL